MPPKRHELPVSNPWLSVPLAEYETHMGSAGVGQLEALSDLFAEAVAFCHPASIAVLGIAGGNGLDRVDRTVTRRVVAIDINPLYLEAVRRRYPSLSGLELHCVDLARCHVDLEPVELVHAGLIFEHAEAGRCLENALSLVASGGHLSVVLQMPSEIEPAVSPSPHPSIQNLKSHFSLVDPAWLRATLEARQFRLTREARRALPAGKGFWLGIFARQ
jgi:hypothetical protein